MPTKVTADELHARVVARIRELAKERDLSIEALAGVAGVSESHLWGVLAGRYSPSLIWLSKIAAGLGVDPAALFRKPRK